MSEKVFIPIRIKKHRRQHGVEFEHTALGVFSAEPVAEQAVGVDALRNEEVSYWMWEAEVNQNLDLTMGSWRKDGRSG